MPDLLDRRTPVDTTVTAVVVLGIEALHGSLTIHEFQVAVQRLERAIRPWDSIVNVSPRTVGVLCTTLSNVREVEAIAQRLVDVVRAPMAVGDEVREVGVCLGSAVVAPGEDHTAAFTRAREAMRGMRAARETLVVPTMR